MRRSEFIKLWADAVAEGRKKNHPDIRPSEAAVSRMADNKKGAQLWAKHRAAFARLTVTEAQALLLSEDSGVKN
jgi:hypothetical protein